MILWRAFLAFFVIGALCLVVAGGLGGGAVYAQLGPSFGGLEESETGPLVTGKVVEDGKVKDVIIISHSGQWTAFPSMGGGNLAAFLVSGKVQNTSGKKLTYVKFQFELVGEDEIVLYRDYGYNRKAEMLRDEEYESGEKSLAEMGIEEIPSKGEDGFRFVFFKDDISEFQGYRIRVMEVR
jgi:hypothetical protein